VTITSEGAGRPIGSTVFSVGKSNLIRHRPKMKGWEVKTIGFDQLLYILPLTIAVRLRQSCILHSRSGITFASVPMTGRDGTVKVMSPSATARMKPIRARGMRAKQGGQLNAPTTT